MFCALDSVPYDRYIFFEDFNDEIPDLLNTLGWEEDLDLFKLDKKPTIQKSIESFFTQDDVKRLVRHYKDDFEILGYPKIPKGYMGFYSHAEHLREIFHTKNE